MSAAMLHVNNLTYRIGTRLLLEDATVALPEGHKIGLVGRKTGRTLLGPFRRLAHARRLGRRPLRLARCAPARRADQLSRPRGHDLAQGLHPQISTHHPARKPRPRPSE